MKIITGVDEKLELYTTDANGEDRKDNISFRDMFRTVIAMSVEKSGAQVLDLYELGLKIRKSTGADLILEDAEFKLLKEKTNTNPLQQPVHFLGQLLYKLKEAETTEYAVSKS